MSAENSAVAEGFIPHTEIGDRAGNIVRAVLFERIRTLTPRMLEIFRLIGQGWGAKEIAAKLGRSSKTIETYREVLKKKLVVDGRGLVVAAVRFAVYEEQAATAAPANDLDII